MRGRRLRWGLVVAGLAVVFAAGVVVFWPREGRITRENYARIELGMSQTELMMTRGRTSATCLINSPPVLPMPT